MTTIKHTHINKVCSMVCISSLIKERKCIQTKNFIKMLTYFITKQEYFTDLAVACVRKRVMISKT